MDSVWKIESESSKVMSAMTQKPLKCEVCEINTAKYKCPKCSVSYCTLACYKAIKNHPHVTEESFVGKSATSDAKNGSVVGKPRLASDALNEIYQTSPELQDLLRYNTVKFHLSKVYKILKTSAADVGDKSSAMTKDSRRELASNYLNTLRYGGVHFNEAIEEFCQYSLQKLYPQETRDNSVGQQVD